MTIATELLTIEAAAERLGQHPKTVWRKVNAYRDYGAGHGGWPPGTWVNLNPDGEKAVIRICWEELVAFLKDSTAKSLLGL
jgi:hypothetical protein